MMNIRFTMFFLLCSLAVCATAQAAELYAPPSTLPHTTPEMKTAGFWISRAPQPDTVILSPQQISGLNEHIRNELKLTKDLQSWPSEYPGAGLAAALQAELDSLRDRQLMSLDGNPLPPAYWQSMQEALNIQEIPQSIPRQYGLITRYADQRFLPTEEGLYAQAHDVDFDELQNSALDIGTPVVVLRQSRDKGWVYVESAVSSGWVKAAHVARFDDKYLRKIWSTPFVVTTVPKADVYLDQEMTKAYGFLRMGARLPVIQKLKDRKGVLVPVLESDGTAALKMGFIAAEDVHEGYLPYTPRQIFLQAFKMLNQPYGWGGMYGEQDCSRFLLEVFSTVGIELPRDSKNQVQAGELLAAWEAGTALDVKQDLLNKAGVGGITILGMKGHIMLYLGSVDGRPYAIHSVWAYRRSAGDHDDVIVLNGVVVSDLGLGEGSRKGSLLDRLNTVRLMKSP